MGTVVYDAPSSRSRKSSSSSKIGGRKSSSSISKNSSNRKKNIYWASPKYCPYLTAALNNTRETGPSKDDNPSFGFGGRDGSNTYSAECVEEVG